jgi:lipopolysaccharide export system ATP-binding protein
MSTLHTKNLFKKFGEKTVIRGVSMNIHSGEVVGLLGPNGAGKTTIFYMIVGLIKPTKGTVLFDGEDITALPMYLRARRGISYLPQESSAFRKLSVEENILAILETLDFPKYEIRRKLNHLLGELNLRPIADRKAYLLSGGERRRVEITRALVLSPKFILLDEPFAGIDPIAVGDIKAIIQHLKENGIGIIITDHNVRETLGVCDRAYLIHQGKIFIHGTPHEITSDAMARKIYLGEDFTLPDSYYQTDAANGIIEHSGK